MNVNRREFIVLSAAVVAGCAANVPMNLQPASIDAGPASDFAADGVYSQFRQQGFFVVRKGKDLSAISSICTHRRCKVVAQPDDSFHCPCHGSSFDPNGKVTHGPAIYNLSVLPTSVNSNGHLIVDAVSA
ncbi:MAG: Rieske 2Fe-2S domain-containing protein [Tepidisphaeraceae bacterium]|jgi:cytochrome b6-f complex iron-sulfur subunit